jgi:class 3 adenylate cyclase
MKNSGIPNNLQSIKNSELEAERNGLTKSKFKKTQKSNYQTYIFKKKLQSIINSAIYKILLFLFIFYVIFSYDLRHFMATKDTDFGFYIVTIISILFFIFDIVANCINDEGYANTLVFYCEVVSTLTLFFDIGWIYENFFVSSVSKANASASVGAEYAEITLRAERYLYVMTFLRMFRLTYCLKFNYIFYALKNFYLDYRSQAYAKSAKRYVEIEDDNNSFEEASKEDLEDFKLKQNVYQYIHPKLEDFDVKKYQEIYGTYEINDENKPDKITNTGEELSQLNTKTIIFILLFITAISPIFTTRTYWTKLEAYDTAGTSIAIFAQQHTLDPVLGIEPRLADMMDQYAKDFTKNDIYKLMRIGLYQKGTTQNTLIYSQINKFTESEIIEKYRTYEFRVYNYPEKVNELKNGDYFVTAYFDIVDVVGLNFILNILRTIFALLLCLWITFFIFRDTNKLIINPMKQMMQKIKRIQFNPVIASKEAEEENLKLEVIIKKNRWRRMQVMEEQRYETSLLSNTLVKSGALLALGFGEAGTEIIINNLKKDKLNPLIKGSKVICLFGFCDIRFFASATEELREGVLKFVNDVAEILHFNIDKYGGSCNKNLGDAFLVLWKFPNEEIEQFISYDDNSQEMVDIKLKNHLEEPKITYRCELAILSFVETLIEIKRSKRLSKYSKDPGLKKKVPEFEVKMGFGLHMGWAIEGAIGSHHKIDASYLSPNVNLASRLLAATKQFNVNMLISGQVIEKISEDNAKRLRLIDIVNVKGSKQALKMYTFDLSIEDLSYKESLNDKLKTIDNKGIRKRVIVDIRKRINKFQDWIFGKNVSTKGLLINHPEIKRLRRRYPREFFETWEKGFENYIKGNWKEAYDSFCTTRNMIPKYEDGPSVTLLNYIKRRNLKAPDDWNGVRALMSK